MSLMKHQHLRLTGGITGKLAAITAALDQPQGQLLTYRQGRGDQCDSDDNTVVA